MKYRKLNEVEKRTTVKELAILFAEDLLKLGISGDKIVKIFNDAFDESQAVTLYDGDQLIGSLLYATKDKNCFNFEKVNFATLVDYEKAIWLKETLIREFTFSEFMDDHELYLQVIGILPEYQHRGYLPLLISKAICNTNATKLYLDVLPGHDIPIKAYKKYGFKIDEEFKQKINNPKLKDRNFMSLVVADI